MKSNRFVSHLVIGLSLLVGAKAFGGELDVKRHSGEYIMDYAFTDNAGEFHSDTLFGSIHGAIGWVSQWGAGATGFNWVIPLYRVEGDLQNQIDETVERFLSDLELFVDELDWPSPVNEKFYNWLLISENGWIPFDTLNLRQAAKDEILAKARQDVNNWVEGAIAGWNNIFEQLPQATTIDATYGTGLLAGLGLAGFYFNSDAEHFWGSGMVNNARLTVPMIRPLDGFLTGTTFDGTSLAGLGCIAWMAADELGCFKLAEGEGCHCQEVVDGEKKGYWLTYTPGLTCNDGSECTNECKWGPEGAQEVVDMASLGGVIGELSCAGVLPGIAFAFDIGYGVFGMPKGTLLE